VYPGLPFSNFRTESSGGNSTALYILNNIKQLFSWHGGCSSRCVSVHQNGTANCKLKIKMICVEGIIIPASWDKNGNIVDLAIATRDEEEYLITDQDQVSRLKPLLRQEVEIRGILQTKKGRKFIKVKRFSKLETTSNTSNMWLERQPQ
jgi:hypothetical protein